VKLGMHYQTQYQSAGRYIPGGSAMHRLASLLPIQETVTVDPIGTRCIVGLLTVQKRMRKADLALHQGQKPTIAWPLH
jgi:hypothetical protein